MEGQGISNIYTGSNKIRIRHRSRKEVEKIKRLNTKFSKKIDKTKSSSSVCIRILKDDHQRTPDDASSIAYFMGNSEITQILKNMNIDDTSIEKIIMNWTIFMFLSTFHQSEKIVSFGKDADKVFILLQGEIKVISPVPVNKNLSGYQYFEELSKLIKNAEKDEKYNELLTKTVFMNNYIYYIDMKDLNRLKFVIFKFLYDKYYSINKKGSNSEVSDFTQMGIIVEIMNKAYISPSDLKLTYPLTFQFLGMIKDQINKELINITNEFMTKYKHFTDEKDKKTVKIVEFLPQIKTDEGSFIGNTVESKYYETAISNSDSFLLTLPYEIYNQYVTIEKDKVKMKEIAFLMSTFIFKHFNLGKFRKSYYNYFKLKEYHKGDIIISENKQMIDHILIIKEGELTLTINKTTKELFGIVKYMDNLLREKIKIMLDISENIFTFPDELDKKERYKIMNISDKDSYGTELVFFGMSNLFNLEVVSKKAKVFEIEVGHFIQMIEDNNDYYDKMKKFNYNKIKGFVDRLRNIIFYSMNAINKKANDRINVILFNDINTQKKPKKGNLLNCSIERLSLSKISLGNNTSSTIQPEQCRDNRVKSLKKRLLIDCENNKVNDKNTLPNQKVPLTNENHISINAKPSTLYITSKGFNSLMKRKKPKMIFEDHLLNQIKLLNQTSHFISNNTITHNYFTDSHLLIEKIRNSRNNKKHNKSSFEKKSHHICFDSIQKNKSKNMGSELNESADNLALSVHQKTSTFVSIESKETNDEYIKTVMTSYSNNKMRGKIVSKSLFDEKKKYYIKYKKEMQTKLNSLNS